MKLHCLSLKRNSGYTEARVRPKTERTKRRVYTFHAGLVPCNQTQVTS